MGVELCFALRCEGYVKTTTFKHTPPCFLIVNLLLANFDQDISSIDAPLEDETEQVTSTEETQGNTDL